MMMKSIFEELGSTYTLGKDGMLYPNLTNGDEEQQPIGRWGRMHRAYLKATHSGLYEQLFLNGTLFIHLADADKRANVMKEQQTTQKVRQEGITEKFKAESPMEWVRQMNSIRSRIKEIVINEVVNVL